METGERRVEVLVFDGCPNADTTLERARGGRVDGIDVDSSANERDDYGLQCRVYVVNGRLEGAPPMAWIASALGASDAAATSTASSEEAAPSAPACCQRASESEKR
jgi:hypothetical protein